MLHSPFMKERHWNKLAMIVKKDIPFKQPTFCMADLIKLELHKFSEDVEELVESAQKEDKISKNLNKIKTIWEDQTFTFESKEDGIPLLTQLDTIQDFVDQHNLDFAGMASSKDVAEFREEVDKWYGMMKTIDKVLAQWVALQRDWSQLRPIFMESDDIKQALPEETKKFEGIDSAFCDIMRAAQEDPLVTE